MAQQLRKPSQPNPPTEAPTAPDGSSICVPGELKIADLTAGQGLTERYDEVLLKLCDTSAHVLTDRLEDSATRFCHHVRHALNADTVYLCNRASLSLITSSTVCSALDTCEDTRQIHAALTTMVSDLWNCTDPLSPPLIKVFPEEPGFFYSIIPLDTQKDQLLIITNADTDRALIGDYLADALSSVYGVFYQSHNSTPATNQCEATVFDRLQHKYRITSKKITAKRLELFQSELKQHAVEFEGLSLASKSTKPEVLRTRLIDALYKTARLWNDKFKVMLDCYVLAESSYGYKTLCDNEKLLSFNDSRTLKIRVHAESLANPNFIDALQDLTDKAVIHATRLNFSVIAQTGECHTQALHKLHERFGIPYPPKAKKVKPVIGFADEFDMMQVNGVKTKNSTTKQG